MRHSLQITGYGIRLRPVEVADAGFIVNLRNLPQAVGTIGDTSPDHGAQERWIEAYWERPDDYYFIVETCNGKSIGTIAIYDVVNGTGEWGRWIILPGIMAALSSAILVYDLAFSVLELRELRGCVVSDNTRVISFHRKCGMRETGIERHARQIGGRWVDLVWLTMTRHQWSDVRQRLHPLAEAAEKAILNSV
jgi:RimJ/RimL family protein N-acetyltransferase